MSSMFESQRKFGQSSIFSKSVRNPPPFNRIEPKDRQDLENHEKLENIKKFEIQQQKFENHKKFENPDLKDPREDLRLMAAAQMIGAARAQMLQQHQVKKMLRRAKIHLADLYVYANPSIWVSL